MLALVLSGGGIKGAYQAGAIQAVFDSGLRPGIVTGISVGALNAAFLAVHQDSDQAGARLSQFWEMEVTEPAKFVKKRPWYDLVYRVLTKRWDGVVDTKPLAEVVGRVLAPHFPRQGGIQVRVGAVDLYSGALVYTGPDSPDFTAAVLASTAEPVSMPLRSIRGCRITTAGSGTLRRSSRLSRSAPRVSCASSARRRRSRQSPSWTVMCST